MMKTIKLLSIGFLGALAMSSCAKEDPKQEFAVTFLAEGAEGSGHVNPAGRQVGEEGTNVVSVATKDDDYLFDGWYDKADPKEKLSTGGDITVSGETLTVKFTERTSNKTYLAKFTDKLYKVTFSVDGTGKVTPEADSTSIGNYVHSKADPGTGYGLEGWFCNDQEITETTTTAEAYVSVDGLTLSVKASEAAVTNTYTAKFKKSNTVVFESSLSQGGEPDLKTGSAIEGKYISSTFVVTKGYTFDVWCDSKGGVIKSTTEGDEAYVSNGGLTLNVKSSSDVAGAKYTAKVGKGAPRIYVSGSGATATLELTYDPKVTGDFFQWGSVIAWKGTGTPGVAPTTADVLFNPSNQVIQKWDSDGIADVDFPTQSSDNIKLGKGDPCRLVGLTQQEIKAGTKVDNGLWRLPTHEENLEFISIETQSAWTTLSDVYGYYFGEGAKDGGTGGDFMPAVGTRKYETGAIDFQGSLGQYWSSTPGNVDDPNYGFCLYFSKDGVAPDTRTYRSYGQPVRCIPQ
ncbi:MAG: InlB B-repeat-containing protein [Phocaeicola sp.]